MTAREREKEIRGKLAIGKVPSMADAEWLLDRNERLEKALQSLVSAAKLESHGGPHHSGSRDGYEWHGRAPGVWDKLHDSLAEAESILNESDVNKGEGSE